MKLIEFLDCQHHGGTGVPVHNIDYVAHLLALSIWIFAKLSCSSKIGCLYWEIWRLDLFVWAANNRGRSITAAASTLGHVWRVVSVLAAWESREECLPDVLDDLSVSELMLDVGEEVSISVSMYLLLFLLLLQVQLYHEVYLLKEHWLLMIWRHSEVKDDRLALWPFRTMLTSRYTLLGLDQFLESLHFNVLEGLVTWPMPRIIMGTRGLVELTSCWHDTFEHLKVSELAISTYSGLWEELIAEVNELRRSD